jgi:hypothetical protein
VSGKSATRHITHTGHDHERKLIKKVKDLNNEIVNNASKVHTALKLSQDDQQTITTLRAEVEKVLTRREK